MRTVNRHARHLTLARAEQAAGQAFGYAEDGVAAVATGIGRVTMTATGAAVVAAVAATLAWAL